MPKPYKGKSASALTFNPNDLIKHQSECAAIIGAIALEWSAIEALLSTLYVMIVFGDRDDTDLAESIVLEAFEATAQFGTKRKLLLNATETRVNKDMADDFSKVLHELQEAYEARNKVVHARWSVATEAPHDLVRQSTLLSRDKPMSYTKADLIPTVRKIVNAYATLAKFFFNELRPKLKPSPLVELLTRMYSEQKPQGTT